MKTSTRHSAGNNSSQVSCLAQHSAGNDSSKTSSASERRAIGYVRVQKAADGMSLAAQQAAISQYCAAQGLRLIKVCHDVASGGKNQRPGLQDALESLVRDADVLIVLRFDRLSRSIGHFRELYERYLKDSAKELLVLRESIGLEAASIGWELVSTLLACPATEGRS